jgi:hypothetical protein
MTGGIVTHSWLGAREKGKEKTSRYQKYREVLSVL